MSSINQNMGWLLNRMRWILNKYEMKFKYKVSNRLSLPHKFQKIASTKVENKLEYLL
jgi:hypothetical protein